MEEQQPAVEPIKDEYDLGDTDLYPRREVEPYQKPGVVSPPAAEVEAPPVAEDRPRNADGTFAPKAPTHPNWLVEQATDCGLSAEDIASFSQEQIGLYVRNTYRERERLRSEFAAQQTVQQGQVRPQPVEEDLGITWGADEEGKPMSEKDYHPGLVSVIKSQAKKLKELEQRDLQRETSRAADLIDQAFASLGETYQATFGTVTGAELAETQDPALDRRIAVLNKAGVNFKQPPANLKARIKAAAERLFPVQAAKPKEEEANPYEKNGRVSPEQWREAAVARPTQRKGAPEPPGDAKAVNNLTQRMRESGMDRDSEVMDGLLGE